MNKGVEVDKLISILKDKGKVTVKLLEQPWDESWGEKGMIAEISYIGCKHGDHEFRYDYNKHKAQNLPLQSHDWYIGRDGKTGTAFEAGMMDEYDIKEDVYHDGFVPVEIIEGGFLGDYLKDVESGCTLSYVQWLEKSLEETTIALRTQLIR